MTACIPRCMQLQPQERKAHKVAAATAAQWKTLKPQLKAGSGRWSPGTAARADAFLAAAADKAPNAYLDALSWKLGALSEAWKAAAGGDQKTGLAVAIWSAVCDAVRHGLLAEPAVRNSGAPNAAARKAASKACSKALRLLQLADCAAHMEVLAGSVNGPSGRKESSRGRGSGGAVAEGGTTQLSDARFQLRHCGPLLPRLTPAERDTRVVTFNPDPWQRKVRKRRRQHRLRRVPCVAAQACSLPTLAISPSRPAQVLDVIDAGASALVVAPTSRHVMEQAELTFAWQRCFVQIGPHQC